MWEKFAQLPPPQYFSQTAAAAGLPMMQCIAQKSSDTKSTDAFHNGIELLLWSSFYFRKLSVGKRVSSSTFYMTIIIKTFTFLWFLELIKSLLESLLEKFTNSRRSLLLMRLRDHQVSSCEEPPADQIWFMLCDAIIVTLQFCSPGSWRSWPYGCVVYS